MFDFFTCSFHWLNVTCPFAGQENIVSIMITAMIIAAMKNGFAITLFFCF